jgi:M6 family metalloprotease-like protein
MKTRDFVKKLGYVAGIALALSLSQEALAVPAYPGLLPMLQSNGETIMVQLRGDEFSHAYFTPDGYLLVKDGMDFYYASIENGVVEKSSVRANDVAKRTASEKLFLASLDKDAVIRNFEVNERESVAHNPRRSVSRTATSSMVNPSNPLPGVFPGTTFPAVGSPRVLVVLAAFSDLAFQTENAHEYFNTILSTPNYTENGFTGSALDFYSDASSRQFTPQFDVVGPVTLPKPMSYYGGDKVEGGYSVIDSNAAEMVVDACRLLDSQVDFSRYDANGDGLIDNVFIFYAGRGQASGGDDDTVWPHSWDVSQKGVFLDGVKLGSYACSNEITIKLADDGESYELVTDAIGTFCHEFGHVVGLPDLYSTSYTAARTPDSWDIMCSGSYNNSSHTPPTFSSWERAALGWLTPQVLERSGNYVLKNNIQDTNTAYLIPTYKANEFFLLENRYPVKWDEFVPGNGMLVWHIDYDDTVWTNNVVNDTPEHQYVDIIEAHGLTDYVIHELDPFPSDVAFELSFDADPSDYESVKLADWSGRRLNIGLFDIAEDPDTHDISFYAKADNDAGVNVAMDADTNLVVDGLNITLSEGSAEIYSVNGVKVADVDAGHTFALPSSGVYLVKSHSGISKIFVK